MWLLPKSKAKYSVSISSFNLTMERLKNPCSVKHSLMLEISVIFKESLKEMLVLKVILKYIEKANFIYSLFFLNAFSFPCICRR